MVDKTTFEPNYMDCHIPWCLLRQHNSYIKRQVIICHFLDSCGCRFVRTVELGVTVDSTCHSSRPAYMVGQANKQKGKAK